MKENSACDPIHFERVGDFICAHNNTCNNYKRDALNLGSMARINKSIVHGPIVINPYSQVNRCVLGRYFGLGLYSYVCDSNIGRYCSFGSRISVGPFNHPVTWLLPSLPNSVHPKKPVFPVAIRVPATFCLSSFRGKRE